MKNLKSFFSGMLAMAMVMALTGTAFAAAGKLQAGTSGIVVMDQVKVKPGEEYTVDGKKIPAVVTYSDTSGKIHNYVPVNMVSDYLDIPTGWSEKRNSVVLGPTNEGAEYHYQRRPGQPHSELYRQNSGSRRKGGASHGDRPQDSGYVGGTAADSGGRNQGGNLQWL